jgi:hypothetical protein
MNGLQRVRQSKPFPATRSISKPDSDSVILITGGCEVVD